MDKDQVKRNYNYIIYNLLKDNTAKDGAHLSAPAICRLIAEKYGVKEPDRKTIYAFEKDFRSFGYDVQHDRKGYYLGERILTEAELQLLIDGIYSVNGLDATAKEELTDKLCEIVGRDAKDINPNDYVFEYDYATKICLKHDVDCKENMEKISSAIKDGKKVVIKSWLPNFTYCFLDEVSKEEFEYFDKLYQDKQVDYIVNPYKIVRNYDNVPVLLFYIIVMGKLHIGKYELPAAGKGVFKNTVENKDNTNEFELFKDVDLRNFGKTNYHKWEKILSAELSVSKQSAKPRSIHSILCLCESKSKFTLNGEDIICIKYKRKNEQAMITELIKKCDFVVVRAGSDLYNTIKDMQENLSIAYGK